MKKVFSKYCFLIVPLIVILSGCTVVFTVNTPLNPTPAIDARTSSRTVVLSWEYDGSGVSFDVYMGTSSDSLVLVARDLSTTTIEVSDLTPDMKYYWKVKAFNAFGQYKYSQLWTFEIIGGKHYALAIGIGDYDAASDLNWTVSDANDVKTCIDHLNLEYQVDQLLTRVIKSDIDTYFSSLYTEFEDGDTFLFYYAGHGGYDYSKQEAYLYLSNGGKIYVTDLRDYLNALSGTIIVVLDSCHSGGFTGMTVSRESLIAELARYNDSFITGLTSGERSNDKYILTAAQYTESSWEDASIRNGVFTFFFADGLGHVGLTNPLANFDSTYNADINEDEKITLDEIYDYTYANVNSYLNNIQHVQVNPSDSDYVIASWD
jgi:hypothetical protein